MVTSTDSRHCTITTCATIGNSFYIIGGGDNKSGIYNSSLFFLFSICGFMFCPRQGLVQIGLNFFNIHHVWNNWFWRKGFRVFTLSSLCLDLISFIRPQGLSKFLFVDELLWWRFSSWSEWHGETGIYDTLVLNMDTLVWSLVASVKGQTTISSEVSIISLMLGIPCSFEVLFQLACKARTNWEQLHLPQ